MSDSSRRKFLSHVGKATLTTMAGPGIISKTVAMSEKSIFIHHVYFWLKDPNSEADCSKLLEGLNKLSKVKTIQKFYIGKPANTNRSVIDRSYAFSWLAFFDSAADQDSYQVDPIHLKFVEDYSHLWSKVIVYDSVDV
jgi:hypothetical protein